MHIASNLNAQGIFSDLDRPWTRSTIRQILTNPKYVGSNVYNRRSFKLKMKRLLNPPDMWVLKEDAFPAIIADELFWKARQIIEARHIHLTDDELLARLRTLLERSGRLSGILIDEADDMPSSSIYALRFGGLHRAYELIGWNGRRDSSYIETNQMLRRRHRSLVDLIIKQLRANGTQLEFDNTTHLLTLDRELKVSVVLSPCYETQAGSQRWRIRFDAGLDPDITIAARLAPGNQSVQDYYLFPRIDMLSDRLRLAPNNGVCLDLYRFENLDFFYRVSRRVSVKDAA